MKRRISTFFLVMAVLLLPMMLGRLVFLFASGDGNVGLGDVLPVLGHGLPLDLSIAGYVMVGVGLLLLAQVWTRSRWLDRAASAYFILVGIILSCCIVLNIALYRYWQFPLDATPLFYFLSSPTDALASVGTGYIIIGVVCSAAFAAAIAYLLVRAWNLWRRDGSGHRVADSAVVLLLTAAMFLLIRGGVTVSTMNTGKAYFSDRMLLNHAAVNPVLSLMESLLKDGDFGSQYRFLPETEADEVFAGIMSPRESSEADRPALVADGSRPDVVLIILEGFSSHLMQSLGGESGVAVELDSIAHRGLLYTNFYACSFRTDRGLVAVLSGFPSQPTTSIMKYPRKTSRMPGIAMSLRAAGYSTTYYYGGDADFTNMRSYLHNTGFQRIVCDKDFPVSERMSKWGVHDHVLAQKFKDEFVGEPRGTKPRFCVVQTSSSHEPFEVPYAKKHDARQNAFCYTDSVVGDLVRTLEHSAAWRNTLVVIVPDHMGGYPDGIPPTSVERYKIPLIMTGGALLRLGTDDTLGDQTDVAATLLGALKLPADGFIFSKDLLDAAQKRRAYFSFPDLFGWIDADGTCIFDNASGKVIHGQSASGPDGEQTVLRRGKAYLQKIYDELERL